MTRKEKGFSYIDSHSGAGMYQLSDEYAQKTGEYKDGIEKLLNDSKAPSALMPYISLIKELNGEKQLSLYPGSPGIAKQILRRQDAAHLFELHNTDIAHLTNFCERWRKARVNQSDGYKGALGQLPPPTRRAVLLIDPPYELKEDYRKAVATLVKGYSKFSSGTYILWYPVVTRDYIENMELQLLDSNIKNLLKIELCLKPDSPEYGMTGTGLFIINPPWQLSEQLGEILPYLTSKLGNENSTYTLQQLIEE